MKVKSAFLKGFFRVLNFGLINKDSLSSASTIDSRSALKQDWQNIGNDIRTAIGEYSNARNTN